MTVEDIVFVGKIVLLLLSKYGLTNSSSEEDVVNAMSNGVTELLTRTELKTIINKLLR